MASQSRSNFDELFEQMVFNEEPSDTLATVSVDNFLNGLLENNDVPILSTPEIEFPLPEILFPKEEDIKMEKDDDETPVDETLTHDLEENEIKEENLTDEEWVPTLVRPNSRKRKIRPEVSSFLKSERDSDESYTNNNGKRKKLYESKPFADPVKERNRQNAINAKINRERKKKEKDALTKQMNLLREENEKLRLQIKAKDKILKKHGLLK